jgi:hypothetical protein
MYNFLYPFLVIEQAFVRYQDLQLSACIHLYEDEFFYFFDIGVQKIFQSHIKWLKYFNNDNSIFLWTFIFILSSNVFLYHITIESKGDKKLLDFRIDDFISIKIFGEFLLYESIKFIESFVLLLFLDDRILIRRSIFIMFIRSSNEFSVFCPWKHNRRYSIVRQCISFVSFSSCSQKLSSGYLLMDQFILVNRKIRLRKLFINKENHRMLIYIWPIQCLADQRISIFKSRGS